MKLTSAGLALLLATASSGSFALTTTPFSKSFQYATPFEVIDLGFGRAGDSAIAKDRLTADSAGLAGTDRAGGVEAPDAFTIGVLPFTFHDAWKFNGLKAGVYSFDTTIAVTGNTGLGVVLFEWFSNGSPSSINFTVAADFKSAHGTGTFTVDPGCDVNYCVFMNIYGWDDGTASTGYNGLTKVTAVPEPTTSALLLAGLATVGWLARRRRAV